MVNVIKKGRVAHELLRRGHDGDGMFCLSVKAADGYFEENGWNTGSKANKRETLALKKAAIALLLAYGREQALPLFQFRVENNLKETVDRIFTFYKEDAVYAARRRYGRDVEVIQEKEIFSKKEAALIIII